VFAEIATDAPMEGIYRTVETPNTVAPGPRRRAVESRDYGRALVQWIDIDPRAWIETRGPKDSYIRGKWDARRGVGRDLHSGGACYAFVDGHVEFKKLRQTVTGGRTGLSPDQFWTQENDGNMWNPYR
jgi:prepilin-type processing-associated H-X9-DG protein